MKRLFDIVFGGLALIVFLPVILFFALWVKAESPGPAFFRQDRVGRFGKIFRVIKLRTMTLNGGGSNITSGGDARVTKIGRFLRKTKIDELPQLFNILKGEMSIVGPRPEVPEWVERYPEEMRQSVLSVRPGLSDLASLEFRNEEELLEKSKNPEEYYQTVLLPRKLSLQKEYVEKSGMRTDLLIILRTMVSVVSGREARHV